MDTVRQAKKRKKIIMQKTKTICIDFDGTIATRNDYNPERIEATPMPGVHDAMRELMQEYHVIIWTTRLSRINNGSEEQRRSNLRLLLDWLNANGFNADEHYTDLSGDKIPAKYYIDDHGIRFNDWQSVMGQIRHIENDKRYEQQDF